MPNPIYFQWQNEYLLRTIYPLRETKLRDFLQYFYEIEIWPQYKDRDAASLAGEIQAYRAAQRAKVLDAYDNYQKLLAYFMDEDVTDQFSPSFPTLDLDTMSKINALHKVFKQFFPNYHDPVKEKYFTSERARQLEDLRKGIQTQLNNNKRLRGYLPASSPQIQNYDKAIAHFTTITQMIDRELSQYYSFLNAYARLDIYKQNAIQQTAARAKARDDSTTRLRLLSIDSASLSVGLALAQAVVQRLAGTPDRQACLAYFLDDDVSDVYLARFPGLEPVTMQRINNLHKAFKAVFPTYKNPVLETSFLSQRIQEMEDNRKIRAQELADKQRAATWIQPGTPGWDANQKSIDDLQNKILKALDEELNHLYDLRWTYDVTSKTPAQITTLLAQSQAQVADLQNQLKSKTDAMAAEQANLASLGQQLALGEKEQILALVDDLPVTNKDIVLGKIDSYKTELAQYALDQLMETVVSRFMSQPDRYPLWLQYMVIHFSGMRYQSAHGSWADPRELLLSLRIKGVQDEFKRQGVDSLNALCDERFQAYQSAEAGQGSNVAVSSLSDQTPPPALALASEPDWKGKVAPLVRALDPSQGYNRRTALLNLRIDEEDYDISKLSDQQVLDELDGMKEQLPDWMWKEIVKLTPLRLQEVHDMNWEEVTTDDLSERYTQEMEPYREILEKWKKDNLTGWREEHDRTSQLIVTRAVCNEVAEHAQHIRGQSPSGGLTAKPEWYMRREKEPRWAAAGDPAYFVKAKNVASFKAGASILWLQWVNQEPNAWQIAHPLTLKSGEDLIPLLSDANVHFTNTGSSYLRDAHLMVQNASGAAVESNQHQWLRWLHEATIVAVSETVDGPTILTFETALPNIDRRQSTIGVFKRLEGSLEYEVTTTLMNAVFVGYVPEGDVPYDELHDMLDWNHILLRDAYTADQIAQYWQKVTRPPVAPVAFDLETVEEICLVEIAPRLPAGVVRCYELNPDSGTLSLYLPEVALRRGVRLQVNKGAAELLDGQVYYPVRTCDDEPRAEELYVPAGELIDVPDEHSSIPLRVKRDAQLLRICGQDEKGRLLFENTGLGLEKGTRLRVSGINAASFSENGELSGLFRSTGRLACYLVLDCPRSARAAGLFVRTSDVLEISEEWYHKTRLILR